MTQQARGSAVDSSPLTAATHVPPNFEDLFHEQRDHLFGVLCLMTGNRYDAEELAQDAFLVMWERWDAIASIEDPVAYLHRTAVNAFRKRLRRGRVARSRIGRQAEHVSAGPEETVLLHEALRALTARQRAALVLTELLGYTADEASRALGVKASTIGALKYQGRAALKRETWGRG
jgi:RNA polymerase sigma-70 factor (ECF subfamily)